MWSDSLTTPAGRPLISTGPATLPRSAPVWGELPRAPAPPPSESAVSSLSPVEAEPAPTAPTPPSAPSPLAATRTPAPTLSASAARMSAN